MGDGCGQGRHGGGALTGGKAGRGGQLHMVAIYGGGLGRIVSMCVDLCRFARTYLERSVARHTRWHVEGERPSILVGRLPTRRPRLQRLQYSKMAEKNKGDDLMGRCEWHGSENGIANHRGTGGGWR